MYKNKQQTKGKLQDQKMSESQYDNESQQQENQQYQFQDVYQEEQNQEDSQQKQRKNKQLLELQQKRIKQQLKDVSFGELIKYKKLKEQVNRPKGIQIVRDRSKKEIPPAERADKNAPRQIKIMRIPQKQKIKQIFKKQRPKSIDPRFQSYTGSFNADLATKSYSFIQDIQKTEVDYLKKQIKNKRIKQHDRQILLKNYNKVTNDMKRFEHQQIQKKVKSQYKDKNYNLKKRQFKQHVQRAKLDALDSKSQDKRLKKKQKKIQKNRAIQKKRFINSTK